MALLVDLSRGALFSTSLQYPVSCAIASSRNRVPSHVTLRTWNASPALQSELSSSSLSAGFRAQAVEGTSSSSSVVSPTEDKSAFEVPQGVVLLAASPRRSGDATGKVEYRAELERFRASGGGPSKLSGHVRHSSNPEGSIDELGRA